MAAMKRLVSAALALLMAGCASFNGYTLRPGISSEAEVLSVMGTPAMEIAKEDGTRDLVYPRGPLGTQTFMATVGRDGVLRGIRPVLTDEVLNRIRPGLTRKEILEMIGPPGETMHFARSNTTAWDYRWVDAWGYRAIFSVTFDADGIVVSKISQRIEKPSTF
jgi:outer membrane protein assembly factor BamE (lipoprotein component of BamABCDE complex)